MADESEEAIIPSVVIFFISWQVEAGYPPEVSSSEDEYLMFGQ